MIRNTLLLSAVVLLTLPVGSALADGMFIGYEEIYETTQVAFINHDNGTEAMHILPKYEGAARDFAWIIPVPSLPTVAQSDLQLFHECTYLTQPVRRQRDGLLDCGEVYYDVAASGQNDVIVYESEIVGIYETMILGANDATTLSEMLINWGYLRIEDAAEVQDVLQSYIERDWFFVTMKIADVYSGSEPYWYGAIDPVVITFASEDIVYPLEISRISAADVTDVVLYIAAAHRVSFPGAETVYANKLVASEMTAIREQYPVLGAQLSTGDFLTKLTRVYSPAEMESDIVLTPTESDTEFREIIYSGWPVGMGVILLMALGLKLPRLRRKPQSIERG
jgi:hypothetical protein